uniref:Uncharacterized protein n=1 Tax=Timema cristinae TaxID=61476 RepID=A0A7R9DEP5_TIMCR|nr:unnamed protein product [Timema cristinae]
MAVLRLCRLGLIKKCSPKVTVQTVYSSPTASLVLTDSSQLTSDSQHLGGDGGVCEFYVADMENLSSGMFSRMCRWMLCCKKQE